MATYDFSCERCNELTTINQSIKDDIQYPTCPKCNILMSRIYNVPGVKFNGSGFYSTDN